MVQTIEELRQEFESSTMLKAVIDGVIVGSVRGSAIHSGTTWTINKLIVHPQYQRLGIGSKLMARIEERGSEYSRLELFTSQKSERNLTIYQKLGYTPFQEKQVHPQLTLVYLEKQNSRHGT
nr:GNAT family N-acetyltransferase [Paenibacillus oenotherae]